MFIQPTQVNANFNPAVEPIKGLKCPISFDPMNNPVYLKGCEHFFEREVIKDVFNKYFNADNFAPCPMCNRPYSIAKMLTRFETRQQAINFFFERILIVPVVSNEINGLLEKRKNKIVILNNLNHTILEQNKLLMKRNEVLTEDIEEKKAALCRVSARKKCIKREKNEALRIINDINKEKNKAIEEKNQATIDKNRATKNMNFACRRLKISYSIITTTVATTAFATTAAFTFFIKNKK